jgi:hypothetical protein
MVSPDSQATACPLSGRNSTYRPVQISGTGSLSIHPIYKAPPLAAVVPPHFSWTGCYIGGHIGGGWGRMENEHWPCTLTNDEVTLPVAALGSGVDRLGPFVDGDAILDGILRRSRSARAAAFVPAREMTP